MLSLVEKLRKIDETRQWYADNAISLMEYLGEDVIDENTDYTVYQKRIIAFNAINEQLKSLTI